MDAAFIQNEKLVERLQGLLVPEGPAPPALPKSQTRIRRDLTPEGILRNADAIVAHIEINEKHGVGVLINRLFGGYPNVISVRSQSHFGGGQDFGSLDLCISHKDRSRDAVVQKVRQTIGPHTIGRILCSPYFTDDVLNALALRDIFKAPLCTYLLDDQNVSSDGIPDALLKELLGRSSLRLAVSAELAACYEMKYGYKMWFMPPVVRSSHILSDVEPVAEALSDRTRGVIVGNIWGQHWLELLRETVRGSGVTLHWYSNSGFRYLSGNPQELERDSILVGTAPTEEDLADRLRKTAFAVVPTGTLDESDDRRFIALLSLPSRIPFIMATSHAPVIVLGSEQTAAARFVREMGIGLVAPYERDAFRATVEEITEPTINLSFRRKALALAGRFTDAGAAEWIWQSLSLGEPLDLRYEDMMRKLRPDLALLAKATKPKRESQQSESV